MMSWSSSSASTASARRVATTRPARITATPIEDVGQFYPAEDYHQDYYKKNSVTYNFYRWRCGRNQWVEDLWGEDAYRGIATH